MKNATISAELATLGKYMAGEFDNREQSLAEPAWYVSLRLWQRPIPMFTTDSIVLFVEQANMAASAEPYRQRVIRLGYSESDRSQLQARYYMLKNREAVRGGGSNPDILAALTEADLEFLPSCTLNINVEQLQPNSYRFTTTPATDTPCSFNYGGTNFQVFLGFEATETEFKAYDRGIDPVTGKSIWGALMGPFRLQKRCAYLD